MKPAIILPLGALIDIDTHAHLPALTARHDPRHGAGPRRQQPSPAGKATPGRPPPRVEQPKTRTNNH
ncbi:hypothetical protein, partial [Streptomyces sp. N2A]|uniref:hypothetical protein n=1 Tax=Streptomyces sp. N2A TaxID=3073936 RepID=UPI00287023AF